MHTSTQNTAPTQQPMSRKPVTREHLARGDLLAPLQGVKPQSEENSNKDGCKVRVAAPLPPAPNRKRLDSASPTEKKLKRIH